MQDKESEVCITSLTKEEYNVLSMIFVTGVSKFLDETDFLSNITKDILGADFVKKYQESRLNIIYDLADKFNFDY